MTLHRGLLFILLVVFLGVATAAAQEHRNYLDDDFDDVEALIRFIRTGKRSE